MALFKAFLPFWERFVVLYNRALAGNRKGVPNCIGVVDKPAGQSAATDRNPDITETLISVDNIGLAAEGV